MKYFAILVSVSILASSASMANRFSSCRSDFRYCIDAGKDKDMCLNKLDRCERDFRRSKCERVEQKSAKKLLLGFVSFPVYIVGFPVFSPISTGTSQEYQECVLNR